MDETYDAVARTRPRIRRDVLFTRTPRGVLFHNADGGFHLEGKAAYRFATLIVPFLTGEHRVAEVCDGLGAGRRDMVVRLVDALYERGFARDVPERDGSEDGLPDPAVARRFAPQIAYVDHYVDGAEERFERFRQTRVAVVGEDLVARWCVLSLVRNGAARVGVLPGLDTPENRLAEVEAEVRELGGQECPVELAAIRPADGGDPDRLLDWADLDGYDVVVTTGGGAGPRQLFHLIAGGIPEGRTLLPFSVFGGSAVVGPSMAAGTAGCWCCAALRLGANDDHGAAADLWSSIALRSPVQPAAARRPGRPLSAMLGNLLGYEVFRIATGALPAETERQILVQDLDSLDVTAEPLLPHPCCPHCAAKDADDPWTDAGWEMPAVPQPAAVGAPVEAQAGAEELVERLNSRLDLVRPAAGVFRRFTDEPWTQTPLKIGSLGLSLGNTVRREIAAFDVHTVAGARLRALDTAAAVYAEHVVPPRGLLSGSALADARLPRVAPRSLSTAAGTGPDADRVGHWLAATSLLTKEQALVPAAAVRTFGPHNADRLHVPTSGGTGVGGTLMEAAAAGLLSALAYDALQHALHRTGPVSLVAPEELSADAELAFLESSARTLGLDLELLDLGESERTGVHILLARASDPGSGRWVWAVGSAVTRQAAASAAVRDLLGPVQLRRDPESGGTVDTGDPLLADLEPATLAVTAEAAPRPDGSWGEVFQRLREAGRDALAVATGSADLRVGGVEVVRVLLTGGASDAD